MTHTQGALLGVAGVGVGVLGALAIAGLTGGSLAEVQAQRDAATQQNERLAEEVEALKRDLKSARDSAKPSVKGNPKPLGNADGADWGPLNGLPKNVGPGSIFLRFLSALEAAKVWNEKSYWAIHSKGVGPNEVALSLDAVGEGAVAIMGVVHCNTWGGSDLMVTLVFRGQPLRADLASTHLRSRIMAVGRGMELSAEELGRLEKFATRVHVPHPARLKETMVQFALGMPDRITQQFTLCLQTLGERSELLEVEFPAIGFQLSDKYVADLAFAATELPVGAKDVNYETFGPWWSVVISAAGARECTAPRSINARGTTLGEMTWPRLTCAEVDVLP